MNSAQTYKDILFKWKTYLWSFFLALVLSFASAFRGWYVERQAIEEEMQEEALLEEERNPSKVPYIEHFKRNAPSVGWDWEMLAAVAYRESRFNPHTVSPGGAQGLMQLMPVTGRKFGLNDSTFFVPADNIAAGCKYIAHLQRFFRNVEDPAEQTKFVLASYNAGPAHIFDAQALARKYGANPYIWDDVEYYLQLLKLDEYYTDSVVQYGRFSARTTVSYVHNTLRVYGDIRSGKFSAKHLPTPRVVNDEGLQYPLDSEDLMEAEQEEFAEAEPKGLVESSQEESPLPHPHDSASHVN